MFTIRMGLPEMQEFWDDLLEKKKKNNLNSNEEDFFKRFAEAIQFLSANPKHPGLQTHEIEPISKKYGLKVWQSYLDQGENAHRIYWVYGPNRKEFTIIGIEPHPEDKKRGVYERVKLSQLPE